MQKNDLRATLKTGFNVIYNSVKKHWIIYTTITFLPTIWFSFILNYFGVYLGLINKTTKDLTQNGSNWTFFIIAIPFVINLFNNFYSSRSEYQKVELLENEISFYKTLWECADHVCNEKLDRLRQHIISINKGQTIPSIIVTNPEHQLKKILEEITTCLRELLSQPTREFRYGDFYITLIYNISEVDNKWYWLEGTIERDLTLEELVNPSNNSTFTYLINGQRPFYFNNEKERAKAEGNYIYNKQDELNAENGNEVGSIFCTQFQIKKDKNIFLKAILSISTSKKRFVQNVEDQRRIANVRENLQTVVNENFGIRINIELCLLYLSKIQDKMEKEKQGQVQI